MINFLLSLFVTILVIYGILYRIVENEKAVERMVRSAREAEEAGDLDLARRRYDAAVRMSL